MDSMKSATQGGQNKPTATIPQYTLPDQPAPKACKAANVHTLSLFDLSGKTALATGANGGIGGSMAQGLAEAGADIIIFQIPGEKSDFHKELASSTGRKTYVYDCDLGDSASVRSTVQRVFDDGLNVDILCNVAGISSGSIHILHETDEHKDAIIQINFNAAWILSQCIARHMVERKQGGKIINICSLAAYRAQTTFSVYGPMKAAVGQMTNSFANEFGPYNIQVNAIYPGWIHTALAQRFVDDKASNERIINSIPARRWGKPQDFKGIAVFLASEASDYVNGARIFVDGGTHGM
ncbi:putative diacetyl reductase [(R)-acetoin forming] 2 [Coniochaeta pulveracea]|uniref:Putative diacetyl reductase [(R)-acetoin forming] 2 n=1 Tax=Coniochaeta pulveracea TaxID=177199 RepID=A0A420XWI9_9PEZI|nr:putative diacetyl reductase [(R)-acetoin forming] 2 [Coniochaeta pulveracea]